MIKAIIVCSWWKLNANLSHTVFLPSTVGNVGKRYGWLVFLLVIVLFVSNQKGFEIAYKTIKIDFQNQDSGKQTWNGGNWKDWARMSRSSHPSHDPYWVPSSGQSAGCCNSLFAEKGCSNKNWKVLLPHSTFHDVCMQPKPHVHPRFFFSEITSQFAYSKISDKTCYLPHSTFKIFLPAASIKQKSLVWLHIEQRPILYSKYAIDATLTLLPLLGT